MALLRRSSMLIPCIVVRGKPMKRLLAEQIERRRVEFCEPGRKLGIWTTGNRGCNFEKYAWMQRSFFMS